MSFNFNFNANFDEALKKLLEQSGITGKPEQAEEIEDKDFDIGLIPKNKEDNGKNGEDKLGEIEYEFEVAAEAYLNNMLEEKSVLQALDGIVDGVKDGIFSKSERDAFLKEIAGDDNVISIAEINKGLAAHGWGVFEKAAEDDFQDKEIGKADDNTSSGIPAGGGSSGGSSGGTSSGIPTGGTSGGGSAGGSSGIKPSSGGSSGGSTGGVSGAKPSSGTSGAKPSSGASGAKSSGGSTPTTTTDKTPDKSKTDTTSDDLTAGSGISPVSAPAGEAVNTSGARNSKLENTNNISNMNESELAEEKSLREGNLSTARSNAANPYNNTQVISAQQAYDAAEQNYQKALENESEEVKEAETKRSDAQEKIDEFKEQIADKKNTINDKKGQIAENKNTITSLTSAMNAITIPAYQEYYDDEGNVIGDNSADIEAAIKEREAIQAEIDTIEKENDSLQGEIDDLQKEIEGIENDDIPPQEEIIEEAEKIIKEKGNDETKKALEAMNNARDELDSVKQQCYNDAQADLDQAIDDLDEVNDKYVQLKDEQRFSRDDLPKLKDKDGNDAFGGEFLDYKQFTEDFVKKLNGDMFKEGYTYAEGQQIADELIQGYNNIRDYENKTHHSTGVSPSQILQGILDKLEDAKEEQEETEKDK